MVNQGQPQSNPYDKHINMFPPLRGRDSSHKLGNINTDRHDSTTQNTMPAPYPLDDSLAELTPAIPFTSPSSSSSLSLPLSALNFTDSNVDGGQLGTPVTINSNNGMDIFNAKPAGDMGDAASSNNSANNRYELPFNFNSAKNSLNSSAHNISMTDGSRISETISNSLAPPPYEESESRVLQEKLYRTEEKPPIRPLEKRPAPPQKATTNSITKTKTNESSSSRDKLSAYSPDALAFYQIYKKTVNDSSKFTPEIQMNGVKHYLRVPLMDDFISQYNIKQKNLKEV